jgi:hypothetical protein
MGGMTLISFRRKGGLVVNTAYGQEIKEDFES